MENLSRRLIRLDGWIKENRHGPTFSYPGLGRTKADNLQADG